MLEEESGRSQPERETISARIGIDRFMNFFAERHSTGAPVSSLI